VFLPHVTPPGRPVVRRCACIDVNQHSMGVETKNAPPASCAGGASGRSLGAAVLVHGPLPSCALSLCRPPIRGAAGLDIAMC